MFLEVLGVFLGLGILVYTFFQFVGGNKNFWKDQGVIQVIPQELFSFTSRWLFRLTFQEQDLKTYEALKAQNPKAKYGGTILMRHPMLYILDFDLIRNILVKDFDHFINRRGIEFSDEKFDKMLFNMINQEWKDMRTIMSPTFTTSKMRRMFGVFQESGEKMIKFLHKEISENGAELELRGVCGRYTMDVIASAAFGVDSQNFENENSPFAVHGRMLQDQFGKGMMLKFMLMIIAPKLAKKWKLSFFNKKALDFLESVVMESIRRRKELGEKRNDFLQLLLEAQEESLNNSETKESIESVLDDYDPDAQLDSQKVNKIKLTDELLVAQCNLFFVAGFDATETLLMWTFYELAVNPDIQETLYKGLMNVTQANPKNLTYDTITSFEYLDMVISETLRKYPSAVRSERKCNKDYKVPDTDFVIKKDTHIIVPTYGIHFDPEIFPNPNQFDPERFNAENKSKRHPYAYLPFGVGPRVCIANRFAMMEGKAVVAHILFHFELSPGKKTDIPPKFGTKGVFKPPNGMWLQLKARK